MKEPDFRRWLAHHFSRFTAAAAWLGKFQTRARYDGEPTQSTVLDAWKQTLADVSLEDAISASNALANGDEQFSEKVGFDHHPRDIRRICRGASSNRLSSTKSTGYLNRFAGEPTYKCPHCKDEGVRFVVHPVSVAAARRIVVDSDGNRRTCLHHPTLNPEGSEQLYCSIAACTCGAGYRWRNVTRLVRNTDAPWQLGREENYHGAMQAAECVRQAETASYEWVPNEEDYQGEF